MSTRGPLWGAASSLLGEDGLVAWPANPCWPSGGRILFGPADGDRRPILLLGCHQSHPEIELPDLEIIRKRKHLPRNFRILVAIRTPRSEQRIDNGLRQVVDVVLRIEWHEELNVHREEPEPVLA